MRELLHKIILMQKMIKIYDILASAIVVLSLLAAIASFFILGSLIGGVNGMIYGFFITVAVLLLILILVNFVLRLKIKVKHQLETEYRPKYLDTLPEIRIIIDKYDIIRHLDDDHHLVNVFHYEGNILMGFKISTKIVRDDSEKMILTYRHLKYDVGDWKSGFYNTILRVPK